MRKIFVVLRVLLILLCVPHMAIAAKSGVSPNVLSVPTGPGSISGLGENVSANLNMGLMSYPISIVVPNGRAGMTPQIGLQYSSGAGAGLLGIGWNLNATKTIQRLTVRGLPKYTLSDPFYASNGEIVKIPNSPFYRARIEGGFVRYRWFSTDGKKGYWVAEYPDGVREYYGASSKGQVELNTHVYGLKGTFMWYLHTRIDRNGNRIQYSYKREGTQIYLETISWAFDKNQQPLYQAQFLYEARPDYISDGKPGFDLQTKQRVKEILIQSHKKRIRSYKLTFDAQSGLSRLTKVTRYGTDASKAYPIAFQMKYSNATFSTANSKMVQIPTPVAAGFKNNTASFIDMNGDGLPDVVDTSGQKHRFHINVLKVDAQLQQSGHDFPKSAVVDNPSVISAQLSNPSIQLLDANGDGFTDMVDGLNKKIYLNKGNNKWENQSMSLKSFPMNGKDPNMRFMDYDGDKKTDVISSNGSSTTYWVNNGQGSWIRVDGGLGIGASFSKDGVRLIDMNGDGLQDAVQIVGNSVRYKKYLGYGEWTKWIPMKIPGQTENLPKRPEFADINGDGLSDMVAFVGTTLKYFVNRNGFEFAPGKVLKSFKGVDIPDSTANSVRVADINGNGSRDLVWIDSNGKITYLDLFGERPNLLKEITNGIGQNITISYGSSVYHRLQDLAKGKQWQNKLPMPFTVVNSIKTWASVSQGSPKLKWQKIAYHNGFFDGKEKKFRGFRSVESSYEGDKSIAGRVDEIQFDVGDKDSYFHGKMLRQLSKDDKGKIFQEQKMFWQDCGTPAGADKGLTPPVRFICLKATESTIQEGEQDSNKHKVTRTENQYNAYGQVTVQSNLGLKDKSGDELHFRTTFIKPADAKSDQSIWILDRAQKKEVCEDLQSACAETRMFYDGEAFKGLELGKLTKGLLTRTVVKRKLGDTQWALISAFKRDSFGLPIESRGANNARREYRYDSFNNLFVEEEKIHTGKTVLKTTAIWDTRLGVIKTSTNYNGHVTQYKYDTFSRLIARIQPGDAPDAPTYQYSYKLQSPLSTIETRILLDKNKRTYYTKKQCQNGLGQDILTAHSRDGQRFLVEKHTEYNRLQLPTRQWQPYESDGQCDTLPPATVLAKQFIYDGLGRLVRQTNEDGTFKRMVYKPMSVIRFDEEDNRPDSPSTNTPVTEWTDGLGRVIRKLEYIDTNKTTTTGYKYSNLFTDGQPRLLSVIFPGDKPKLQKFNLVGQLLELDDPDRGKITYTYDQAGNMIEKTDAKGVTMLYTYDAVQRQMSQQQKGQPSTRIQWIYDQPQPEFPKAANVRGVLAAIKYPHGQKYYAYNARQLPTSYRHRVFGHDFDFQMSYDNIDKLSSKTYPDGRKLTFQYDALSRLTAVSGMVKEFKYTPSGLPSSITYQNGVTTTFSYDKRRRPKQISVNGGKIFDFTLSLDQVGNPVSTKENLQAVQANNRFSYDAMYRLTKAQLSAKNEELTYAYDDLRNFMAKTSSLGAKSPAHAGQYTYDAKRIHAAVAIGENKISYDAAGCVTKLNDWTYKWDYLGRLTDVERGGQNKAKFWYGERNFRILKQANGIHTYYVEQDYQIRKGEAWILLSFKGKPVSIWKSRAKMDQFFQDLAPLQAGDKPQPDGKITAADAWLVHAGQKGFVKLAVRDRSMKIDLSKDMLVHSVERMLQAEPEQKHYYHTDHLGSVRAVTDAKGQVISTRTYHPYGTTAAKTGVKPASEYAGVELDDNTGLYAYGLRYFHPQLGRWLSPDPLFESIRTRNDEFNSFGAVMNSPVRYRDVQGTLSESETMGVAAGIGGGLGLLTVAAIGGYAFYRYKKVIQPGTAKLNQAVKNITTPTMMHPEGKVIPGMERSRQSFLRGEGQLDIMNKMVVFQEKGSYDAMSDGLTNTKANRENVLARKDRLDQARKKASSSNTTSTPSSTTKRRSGALPRAPMPSGTPSRTASSRRLSMPKAGRKKR